MNDYATKLYLSDFLREPLIRTMIKYLDFPQGSIGLDVGCGAGSNTMLLVESVGKEGHVTGLDLSHDLLTYAQKRGDEVGLSQQLSFREGNMNSLCFDDNSFNWAWSMDCVGYVPGNTTKLLKDMARVVRPGGSVCISAWSSQQLIPGYPQLEARLNATSTGIEPFVKQQAPESHFLRSLGRFRAAGLKGFKTNTFIENVQAPLNDDHRNALISLFDMRWGMPQSELSESDWMEYQCIVQPDSKDFILDCPDYCAFFTYTVFHGIVVE